MTTGCTGKVCGPDGLGGDCGTCQDETAICTVAGKCCVPSCEGVECGSDGCGGVCGSCANGATCQLGICFECNDQNQIATDGCHKGKIVPFRISKSLTKEYSVLDALGLTGGGQVAIMDREDIGMIFQVYAPNGAEIGQNVTVGPIKNNSYGSGAAITNGGFVTFRVATEVGQGNAVWANRYDAMGQAVGDPIQVNQNLNFEKSGAIGAALPAGGFLAAWVSIGQDSYGNGVYARQFDGSGNAVGDKFRVNDLTAGNEKAPALVVDDDGSFTIAWSGGDVMNKQPYIGISKYSPVGALTSGPHQLSYGSETTSQSGSTGLMRRLNDYWVSHRSESSNSQYSTTPVSGSTYTFQGSAITTGLPQSIVALPDGGIVSVVPNFGRTALNFTRHKLNGDVSATWSVGFSPAKTYSDTLTTYGTDHLLVVFYLDDQQVYGMRYSLNPQKAIYLAP